MGDYESPPAIRRHIFRDARCTRQTFMGGSAPARRAHAGLESAASVILFRKKEGPYLVPAQQHSKPAQQISAGQFPDGAPVFP